MTLSQNLQLDILWEIKTAVLSSTILLKRS